MIDLTNTPEEPVDEFDPDDWFGDESPFSSSEDLAAALFSLGGDAPIPDLGAHDPDPEDIDSMPEEGGQYGGSPGYSPQAPMSPQGQATYAQQSPPPQGTYMPPAAPEAPAPPSAPAGAPPRVIQYTPQPRTGAPADASPNAAAIPDEQKSEMKRRWSEIANHSYSPTSFHVEQQQGPVELPRKLQMPQNAQPEQKQAGYHVYDPNLTKEERISQTMEIQVDPDLPAIQWNTRSSMSTFKATEKIIGQLQLSATHIAWTAAALAMRELNAVSFQHKSKNAFATIVNKGFDQ